MIYIFHGDDQYKSQQAYQAKLSEYSTFEQLHFDNKNIDFDKLNQFINSQSLFGSDKMLILDNPYSLVKSNLEKLQKIIISNKDIDIIIWQERLLKPAENNYFGKATIQKFPLEKNYLPVSMPSNQAIFTIFAPSTKKHFNKNPLNYFSFGSKIISAKT